MITPNDKAKGILSGIKYVCVATTDNAGQPWNTPVAAFYFDNDYTLYWASWQDNQHSKNIRANKKAFVVAFDSTPANGQPSAGVYMLGDAVELTEEDEVMQAAAVFKDDKFNPSDGQQYLGGHPRRIYKFTPNKFWVNDDSSVNGDFIDVLTDASAS